MEGKGLLFKVLSGIDAIDIEVNSTDIDDFCKTVKNISTSFGGINLEDIKAPECFVIEEKLKKELQKINIDFRIFNVKDIEKELLKEINLPENYATAYGMYLCRTAGNIKLYKEKIIDEEEFLYKVGVKKGDKIKVLLDKDSKDEWIKVADASEKDTEIHYINKINERKFILLSIDRTYENAGVFIKKREKDTIDYTVFNDEGKQLEKVRTEILDFKLEEDF